MLKNDLGYTKIGSNLQLKKACENYWSGQITRDELFHATSQLREESLKLQQEAGVDLIPCNDISYQDYVLDMSLMLGVVPKRYSPVLTEIQSNSEIDLYFAMARGYQKGGLDIPAMERAKWFDNNYIVPEFTANQRFKLSSQKAFSEYLSATQILGRAAKPVIIGPVSYLLFGREKASEYGKAEDFKRVDLIKRLVPVYIEIINTFKNYGAQWIQVDEPFLCTELNDEEKSAFEYTYVEISRKCGGVKVLLTNSFGSFGENTALAISLPVAGLHVDVMKGAGQLGDLLQRFPRGRWLSLGLADREQFLKNKYQDWLSIIEKVEKIVGSDRLMIAGSSALMDVPAEHEINHE